MLGMNVAAGKLGVILDLKRPAGSVYLVAAEVTGVLI